MVLNVEGSENDSNPFYMEGFINGNRFKTMIDPGSPVTIFGLDEIKSIMKRKELPVRKMIAIRGLQWKTNEIAGICLLRTTGE